MPCPVAVNTDAPTAAVLPNVLNAIFFREAIAKAIYKIEVRNCQDLLQ